MHGRLQKDLTPRKLVELVPYANAVTARFEPIADEPIGRVEELFAQEARLKTDNVGGVREGVVDGRTGLLVPAGDEAALAEAIGRLIADAGLRERLAQGGRALFEQAFDLSAMLRSLDDEIENQFALAPA